jgi:hypothetical protein
MLPAALRSPRALLTGARRHLGPGWRVAQSAWRRLPHGWRLLPPLARWVAAGFLIPLLAASVAFAALPSTQARPPRGARPAATPQPAAAISIPPGEFAAFARARRRPAAAAPIKRLPVVDYADLQVGDIPPVAATAYVQAARTLGVAEPACQIPWWLLAGIGYVESDHAAAGGSWRRGWDGIADPPIYGPLLDGSDGYPAIPDSDHGRYDPPSPWDRAVGPMQFLPSTWMSWGADGDRDGRRNPQDIWDASLAAGRYLCAGAGDLASPQNMAVAVYSYNHSFDYVRLVLTVAAHYAGINPDSLGVASLPTDPSPKPPATAARHSARRTTRASASPTQGPHPSPSPSASPAAKPTLTSPQPSPSTAPPSPSPLPTPTPLPSLGLG